MNLPFGPILVVGSIIFGIIMFLKILTDYFLKKKLIDTGGLNKEALTLFKESFQINSFSSGLSNSFSALKWGLIFLFGGIGLIVLEFIKYDYQSTIPYGVVAVSVSLGFLTYFFIVRIKGKSVE